MRTAGDGARQSSRQKRLWGSAPLGAAALLGAVFGCQPPAPADPTAGAAQPGGGSGVAAGQAPGAAEGPASQGAAAQAETVPGLTPAAGPAPAPRRVEVKRDGPHGAMAMASQVQGVTS